MNIIAVGIGGFLGALFRYIFVEWSLLTNNFPLGTLTANLVGCFLLGGFLTLTLGQWKIRPIIRLLIGTGAMGSFTTFSTFSLETLLLLRNQQFSLALIYIIISICGGILLAAAGIKLAGWMSGYKAGVEK